MGRTSEPRDGQDPGRCLKELGSRLERVAGQMKAGRENCMGCEAWHIWRKKGVCIFLVNCVKDKYMRYYRFHVQGVGMNTQLLRYFSFCVSTGIILPTTLSVNDHTGGLRIILETSASLRVWLSKAGLDNAHLGVPFVLDPADTFSILIHFIFGWLSRRSLNGTFMWLLMRATSAKEISDFCKALAFLLSLVRPLILKTLWNIKNVHH